MQIDPHIGSPTLLITDDDRALRESLEAAFQAEGYLTWLASDGREAVDIVTQRHVHLALMDLHMPRMSGLQALEEIKRLNHRLPVLLMSADLTADLEVQAKKADAFAVYSKPLKLQQVRADLAAALKQFYNWPRM